MIPQQPVYIVDLIGQVVQAVQTEVLAKIQLNETAALGATLIQNINYQYGHFRELISTLSQWDADASGQQQLQKYPLVFLVQDFREQRGRTPGVYADVSLNIIVCHQTDPNYKITDRMTNVFKPVLYPIYYSLIKQLSKASLTFAASPDLIAHDKWDRAYWGTTNLEGTDKSMLNDFVDAIDIQNISLKISYQPCF